MGSLAAFTLRWVKTWVRISTESYKWCIKKINVALLIFCSLWVRCNLYHHSNKFRPYIAAMIVLFISCFLYPFIHLTISLILLKKINKWIRAAWWFIWESAWSFTCYKWMVDVSLFCFLSISFIKVTEWTCNPCTTLLKTNVHNKVIKSVFFWKKI